MNGDDDVADGEVVEESASTALAPAAPTDDDLLALADMPAVVAVRRGLLDALSDLEALAADGDLDRLLVGIAVLDVVGRDLRELRSAADALAADMMPRKQVHLERVGSFTRQPTSRDQWDWGPILRAIRDRAVATPEGEPRNVVDAVNEALRLVEAVMPLSGSTAARVGKAADGTGLVGALGVDPASVRDRVWKAPSVTFRRAGS